MELESILVQSNSNLFRTSPVQSNSNPIPIGIPRKIGIGIPTKIGIPIWNSASNSKFRLLESNRDQIGFQYSSYSNWNCLKFGGSVQSNSDPIPIRYRSKLESNPIDIACSDLVHLRQMMEKFAEDDRIEQMNAQKRRMKQQEHKRAVEELIQHRRDQHKVQFLFFYKHSCEFSESTKKNSPSESAKRPKLAAELRSSKKRGKNSSRHTRKMSLATCRRALSGEYR